MDYREHLATDPGLIRPAEIYHLRGDYSMAEKELGWRPRLAFEELIRLMVDADLERLRAQPISARAGETPR